MIRNKDPTRSGERCVTTRVSLKNKKTKPQIVVGEWELGSYKPRTRRLLASILKLETRWWWSIFGHTSGIFWCSWPTDRRPMTVRCGLRSHVPIGVFDWHDWMACAKVKYQSSCLFVTLELLQNLTCTFFIADHCRSHYSGDFSRNTFETKDTEERKICSGD